jgi:hypothetical protein
MAEIGQLDLVDVLSEQEAQAEEGAVAMDEMLSQSIDANPNDKLLMEMFNRVTDAEQSLKAVRDLLEIMRQRDEAELP